jgi:4-hydroxy-tetrahydrodipicolinate synthase
VPGRTAVDMLPETVARLAPIDNIVGLKEATGDLARIEQLCGLTPDDFAIYSGDDATAREAILRGANGDISVTANVAPAAMHAMCAAALAGDRARAEELDRPLAGLHSELFVEANPIPVKWALAQMGHIGSGIRLPLTPLSDACHAGLRQAMQAAGFHNWPVGTPHWWPYFNNDESSCDT